MGRDNGIVHDTHIAAVDDLGDTLRQDLGDRVGDLLRLRGAQCGDRDVKGGSAGNNLGVDHLCELFRCIRQLRLFDDILQSGSGFQNINIGIDQGVGCIQLAGGDGVAH